MLDASYQGVKKLYVLAYDNAAVNNQVSVTTLKLVEEKTSTISRLMTWLRNMMKSEKYP